MSEMSLTPPFALRNIYRPLTKLQGGYVFTGVCDSVHRGVCMVSGGHVCCKGGMCGCWGGAWLLGGMCGCVGGMCSCWGACMVGGCMIAGGHVWLAGDMRGCWGACMVAGSMRGCWGVCVVAGGVCRIQQDTVNEQAVCILLECILVSKHISNSVNILLTVTFISCNNVTTKYILKLIQISSLTHRDFAYPVSCLLSIPLCAHLYFYVGS